MSTFLLDLLQDILISFVASPLLVYSGVDHSIAVTASLIIFYSRRSAREFGVRR